MASKPKSLGVGGDNPEFLLRNFGGISNNAAREAINEDDFYWLENAIPLAGGNLRIVPQASAPLVLFPSEVSPPTFTCNFSVTLGPVTTNWLFAAFGVTGNGYVVNLGTNIATQIFTGTLSTASTYATGYNSQGVLIIDPSGYFDWNITTANTLTSQNNALTGGTITQSTSVAGGVMLTNDGITPGTGGSLQNYYQVISATINAAGTGYIVGDVLSLTDGVAGSAGVAGTQFQTQIVVAAVGGGGTITAITLANPGSYAGPITGGSLALPSGTVVAGGSGTGATFTIKLKAITNATFVLSAGTGYTAGTATHDKNGATVITTVTVTTSGVIGGVAIATYAGRVWLASGRTVYFTDINQYNKFGGAGGSFTITDAYLAGSITCLYAANNYLYIFGPISIDALSNVTIAAGVTSFSRINIVTGLGTTQPQSVFGYYRALVFYHATGIYMLSGATPEKISEKISGVMRSVVNGTVTATGCTVTIDGELCAAIQVNFNDTFSSATAGVRTLVLLYFRGRWWAASFPVMSNGFPGGVVSAPNGNGFSSGQAGLSIMFFWGISSGRVALFQAFSSASLAPWILRTRLWDGQQPLREKQSINAGLAAQLLGLASSGATFKVDTELVSRPAAVLPDTGSVTGYQLMVSVAYGGGGQYIGLTIQGDGTNVSQVNLVALRGLAERDMLQ